MKGNIIRTIVIGFVLFNFFLFGCGGGGGNNGGGNITNPPDTPANIKATPGNGQVMLDWDNVTNASSYNIYWATTSGVTKNIGLKQTATVSLYVHTGLLNGTTYYYVVTAVNSAGESAESNEVFATPALTPPPPPE